MEKKTGLAEYFPIWDKLTVQEQELLNKYAYYHKFPAGTVVHNGSADCLGILVLSSGQLRSYMLSDEGREITIFRMFEMDMCLFSASCMMKNIQFEIAIAAEKDTEAWVIPPHIYKQLMEQSVAVANYTNEIITGRFSEVMWLMEQVMWKSFDKRLAAFLLEECNIEDSLMLTITHEKIANHLGTAREVVTRMLRYFQVEGMVKLKRGGLEVLDRKKLQQLAE